MCHLTTKIRADIHRPDNDCTNFQIAIEIQWKIIVTCAHQKMFSNAFRRADPPVFAIGLTCCKKYNVLGSNQQD